MEAIYNQLQRKNVDILLFVISLQIVPIEVHLQFLTFPIRLKIYQHHCWLVKLVPVAVCSEGHNYTALGIYKISLKR